MITLTAPPVPPVAVAYGVRAIRAGDAPALAHFRAGLSPDTVYQRYFAPITLSPTALADWAQGLILRHPCRQFTWVAHSRAGKVLALLELVPDPADPQRAEMGVVVSDSYQRRGIGTALGRYAFRVARRVGIREVVACMLAENRAAQHYVRNLGAVCRWEDDGGLRLVTMTLRS